MLPCLTLQAHVCRVLCPLSFCLPAQMDSGFMQQMMQSPMVQQLLNNPETLRNMLQMNPGIREVCLCITRAGLCFRGWMRHCSTSSCCTMTPCLLWTPTSSVHAYVGACALVHACIPSTLVNCSVSCLCMAAAPAPWLQLMDRDPQMAQMLNNPELLRESFNMMANPVSNTSLRNTVAHCGHCQSGRACFHISVSAWLAGWL